MMARKFPEGVMSVKLYSTVSLATLIAAAALACAPAQAEPLFAFLSPPAQIQVAPQDTQQYAPIEEQSEDAQLDPRFQRQVVAYDTREAPGTVVVDTPHTYLYYVLGNGQAIRYGIGVGRDGFTWSGVKQVARKAEWPDWYPPAEMIKRQPYLPRITLGGPGNPLGARAMYLGTSEYRIHGTNNPATIGKHVSSGCIRLTNEDVTDLYDRVKVGAKVVVLPQSGAPTTVAHSRTPARQMQAQQVSLTSGYAAEANTPAQRTWASIR
jgi:lipoprotein-anchoring transpeptidase ErfK/SrfK